MNKTTICDQVRSGKSVIVNTRGVSMNPLLYEGQTQVLVEPLTKDLNIYDMPIFYRSKNTYVIHRIIKIDEDYIYTRGDNCLHGEKVPKANVFGVVTKIYKGDREILMDDPEYLRYLKRLKRNTPFRLLRFRIRYEYVRFKGFVKRMLLGAKK